jgi:hypothetical protein
VSDTWDDEDRAIARALDAASDAETGGADDYVVDAYRDVLGQLPVPEVTPRVELEDRIVAAALERRPASVPMIAGQRARRFRRSRVAVLATTAVAAAIVIGLIVHSGTSDSPMPGGHVTLATLHRSDVDALVRSPNARTSAFEPAMGRVVIAADGNAAIYALSDPDPNPSPLSIGLVSSGGTTVVGPAQPEGGAIAFVVDHPERVTAVTLIRNGTEIARAELTPN